MYNNIIMSNYGGKVPDYQQNVKQFFGSTVDSWIYKKINNLIVLTPTTNKPVYINNDLTVTGTITAGNIVTPSDVRLKENIEDIDKHTSDDLFTLNPIHFTFKHDVTKKTHYGVLAQDIEQIYPNLVEENNTIGYKTVNYQQLIPIMIAKMKCMQTQINELRHLS